MPLRRRELLAGGAATALLAACGGPAQRAAPRPGRTRRPAGPPDWRFLGASLAGRLVRPVSPGYLTDVQLYDPRFDGVRPRAIAYCATAADVARCLEFARGHDIPVAVRSGGHSYAGYSTGPGLVVDVTPMNAVRTRAGGVAQVGAGARLIDVYTALGAAGVSVPAGSCPTVGIAGLTLGGGQGVVGRSRGLTCDRLSSVTIVTADSVTRTVGPADTTGLFWACQGGGGGNFGVVTEMSFATFPAGELSLFFLTWPWAAAAEVLPAWQAWAPAAPDELWSNCLLLAHPTPDLGVPLLQVGGVYQGPPGPVGPELDRLARLAGSAPATRAVEQVPFTHGMYVEAGCATLTEDQCHLPDQAPGGQLARTPVLARSDYLTRPLPAGGVAAVVVAVDARQRSGLGQGGVAYDASGGAINRVPATATAFVHRDAICSAQYTASFAPGASATELAADQAWLDSFYASQRPYVSGQAYQNYIDPHLRDWARAYYGENLVRLEAVKRRYDPDDVFHFAQSIPLPPG